MQDQMQAATVKVQRSKGWKQKLKAVKAKQKVEEEALRQKHEEQCKRLREQKKVLKAKLKATQQALAVLLAEIFTSEIGGADCEKATLHCTS
jgi:hypothetical protein